MSRAVPAPSRRDRIEAATYDTRDMAELLKLSERSIGRLAAAGEIPGLIRVGKKSVRFSRAVVDRWLKS
jgi:excisionase family DNA binding protein